MKKIHLMVLLIVVALFMMGFIGSASGANSISHVVSLSQAATVTSPYKLLVPGGNAGLGNLSLDNCIMALVASQDSTSGGYSYVSRARDLVDKNDNRTRIIDYIIENPGSTQNDMVKALDMNIGTVRYHLMILALNHRVATYNDGPRLVRYFINKGTYSQEQMMVMSLLMREPTGRLLGAMSGKTALTGSQIAADSGMSYSDINRSLKELTAKGVVIKESVSADRYHYRISSEHEEYIMKNLR